MQIDSEQITSSGPQQNSVQVWQYLNRCYSDADLNNHVGYTGIQQKACIETQTANVYWQKSRSPGSLKNLF